jgi:hypothetical protein
LFCLQKNNIQVAVFNILIDVLRIEGLKVFLKSFYFILRS